MKRLPALLLVTGVVSSFGVASEAFAQPASRPQLGVAPSTPYQGQVVSPYLNLLRRGSSPAVNYYGLVRPEFEFSSSIQGLQQQSLATQQEVAAETLPTTGHPFGFQTQARFFNTLNRQSPASQLPATVFRPRPQLPTTGAQTGYPVPR